MRIPIIKFPELRIKNLSEIRKLTEIKHREKFRTLLVDAVKEQSHEKSHEKLLGDSHEKKEQKVSESRSQLCLGLSHGKLVKIIDSGLLTFLLHCEARIASSLGIGFYTIGPCGEELLGAVALNLRETDSTALHYRHVATSITRQQLIGKTVSEIALARARGYTCSTFDPVTGGKHCAIGGTSYDYIVTSTLASQATPAVGRALGISLSNILLGPRSSSSSFPSSSSPSSSFPLSSPVVSPTLSFSSLPSPFAQNNSEVIQNDSKNRNENENGLHGEHYRKTKKFPADSVSYVSFGDGSVNNAHFLTALNLAKYSQHRGIKCPVIFAISDNDMCISLRGHGWIQRFVSGCGVAHFVTDGSDLGDIFLKSKEAIDYSREFSRPSVLLFENVPRRFGHAATDRQDAYLTEQEILSAAERDPLADSCRLAMDFGLLTPEYLLTRFDYIQREVEEAFNIAVNEPKILSREMLVAGNSQPLAPRYDSKMIKISENSRNSKNKVSSVDDDRKGIIERFNSSPQVEYNNMDIKSMNINIKAADNKLENKNDTNVNTNINTNIATNNKADINTNNKPDTMRKNMTRLFDELLLNNKDTVYIGEDVQHGGYYLVTEGLSKKYPLRVRDFPPDETSLLGVGMGYSQAGLLPIVEIPYAKYLDCASDILLEAINTYWLSNGTQSVGMIIRLQGFDKGIFGGNYHTHNILSIPPGLDVVCYSNGADYARGMRYCLRQVRAGRIIMSVDSTDLLNRRHLFDSIKDTKDGNGKEGKEIKDGKWLTSYPDEGEELEFSQIIVYRNNSQNNESQLIEMKAIEEVNQEEKTRKKKKKITDAKQKGKVINTEEVESVATREKDDDVTIVIVTYGNGVPTSLQAVEKYYEKHQENAASTSSSSSFTSSPTFTSTDTSKTKKTKKSSSLKKSADELVHGQTDTTLRPTHTTDSHTDPSLLSPHGDIDTDITTHTALRQENIIVIDCPYLSDIPSHLQQYLQTLPHLHSVIFADVCKLNASMPLNMFAVKLQNQGFFSRNQASKVRTSWMAVGGANTYNPLGNTVTFLNSEDVGGAIDVMIERQKEQKD